MSGRRRLPEWPTDELAAIGDRLAITTGVLLATEREWVRRRVEKFTFIDDIRVHRSMSIDFVLPRAVVAGGDPLEFVPLALPRKEPLRDLDVVDEGGRGLPCLTRDENSAVSAALLRIYAREVVLSSGRFAGLDEGVATDLCDIAGQRYDVDDRPPDLQRGERVGAAIDGFKASLQHIVLRDESDQQRQLLWANMEMRTFITLLAERYVFFVRLRVQPGERRVVHLSYQEFIRPPAPQPTHGGIRQFVRRQRTARKSTFGQTSFPLSLPTRSLYAASSYHVEVEAPGGLTVRRAELGRAIEFVRTRGGRRLAGRKIRLYVEENVPYAHLYATGLAPGRGVPSFATELDVAELGYVDIELSLEPALISAALLFSAATTTLLLVGLAARGFGAHIDRVGSSAIVVAIPGIFSAFLVPRGHALARRLFFGLRLLVWVSTFTSIAAAGILVLKIPTGWTIIIWSLLTAASILVTRTFLRAYRFAAHWR